MFFIKDLKDLENGTTRVSIDIKDLKDLKRPLDDGQRGGLSPALRGIETRRSLLPNASKYETPSFKFGASKASDANPIPPRCP